MLVKETIKGEIVSAIDAVWELEENRANAKQVFADKLADVIINAIKSTTITYTTGLIAPTGGGAVTGVFENEIS